MTSLTSVHDRFGSLTLYGSPALTSSALPEQEPAGKHVQYRQRVCTVSARSHFGRLDSWGREFPVANEGQWTRR